MPRRWQWAPAIAAAGRFVVCLHGEPHDLGQGVSRGFISRGSRPLVTAINPNQSGRLELAQWLRSRENPLTPRVMVNRIWAHLFGQGIVRTVDNFGSTGESPANLVLLDHLAPEFMHNGWSVKHAVREMVLSQAYQFSSVSDAKDFATDPDNRLVWRQTSRRLDAEEIRDAMLAAAGNLDLNRPVGSKVADLPTVELRPNGWQAG